MSATPARGRRRNRGRTRDGRVIDVRIRDILVGPLSGSWRWWERLPYCRAGHRPSAQGRMDAVRRPRRHLRGEIFGGRRMRFAARRLLGLGHLDWNWLLRHGCLRLLRCDVRSGASRLGCGRSRLGGGARVRHAQWSARAILALGEACFRDAGGGHLAPCVVGMLGEVIRLGEERRARKRRWETHRSQRIGKVEDRDHALPKLWISSARVRGSR